MQSLSQAALGRFSREKERKRKFQTRQKRGGIRKGSKKNTAGEDGNLERAKESLSTTFAWFKPFFGSFVPSLIHFLRFLPSGGASGITGIREKSSLRAGKWEIKRFSSCFSASSLCA